jgi:hypothetical protein
MSSARVPVPRTPFSTAALGRQVGVVSLASVLAIAGTILLTACSSAAASTTPKHDPDGAERGASATVVLVVGDADDLTTGDERLRDHLRTGLNHVVRLVSDDASPDLADVDLLVMSQSSSSGAVGSRYREAPVPALVMNNSVWDDMLLAQGSTDTGDERDLLVLDASSPVVGGLAPGPHRLLSSSRAMRAVTGLAPGGEAIAAVGSHPDQVVLFTIEPVRSSSRGPPRLGASGSVSETMPTTASSHLPGTCSMLRCPG